MGSGSSPMHAGRPRVPRPRRASPTSASPPRPTRWSSWSPGCRCAQARASRLTDRPADARRRALDALGSARRAGDGGPPGAPRPADQAAGQPRPARGAGRSSSRGSPGEPDAPVDRPAIVVAAADHGVDRRGVSAYPAEVTAQMVANFVAGGAAINVLAARGRRAVVVVDVGVAGDRPAHGTRPRRTAGWSAPRRDGTADITRRARDDRATRRRRRSTSGLRRSRELGARRRRPHRHRRDGHRQHHRGERRSWRRSPASPRST